ncbi:MAG TPA: nucleoside triphosphate pyrophosphatase [bacterium]|nr:nucleoside triphosphate pyrophosphatase [bacterium]
MTEAAAHAPGPEAPAFRQTRPYCLASGSPRRAQLLGRLGLRFSVCDPRVAEEQLPGEEPRAMVQRLARLKAQAVAPARRECLVLAGDTVVVIQGQVLGKPGGAQQAQRMLELLSGRSHEVLTGWFLQDGPSGDAASGVERTLVHFRQLPPDWIGWYSRLPEAWDKAGAYAVQGVGGTMVSGIEGSYSNVVGYPVETIFWQLWQRGWLTL